MSEKHIHYITLRQASNILKVTEATVKNWVRLGKTVPQKNENGKYLFSLEYVNNIRNKLASPEGKFLKQRRNKKMTCGTIFPTGYIKENTPSHSSLLRLAGLLNDLSDKEIEKTAPIIIADTAAKLAYGVSIVERSRISGAIGKYIDELAGEADDVMRIVSRYPKLFSINFAQSGNEDIAGAVYLLLQRAGQRKSSGMYYTPERIIQRIYCGMDNSAFFSGAKILDPCCGTGNFLLQLPTSVPPESVYGCDCDRAAVTIARINFAIKYKIDDKDFIDKHIVHCDFLKFNSDKKFDFIVGNPPWGGDFSSSEKQYIKQNFTSSSGQSFESFSLITEHAIKFLADDGTLCFLLPQSVLNVKKHKRIREFILQNTVLCRLELLGEIFRHVNCPAVILGIKKTKMRERILFFNNGKECFLPSTVNISAESFNLCRPEELSIIERMENIANGTTLTGNADFALGIVTGNNKEYIFSEPLPQTEVVLKGSDIFPYKYKTPDRYIKYAPETFQQSAPTHIYRAGEKLFYKFISAYPIFAYDNKGRLSLNSCNIVIPHADKFNIKYILAVLNSTAVRFYFKYKFDSVKILRHHLEKIPIPQVPPETLEEIVKLTDKILSGNENDRTTLEKLDSIISNLYQLSSEEHQMLIKSVKS